MTRARKLYPAGDTTVVLPRRFGDYGRSDDARRVRAVGMVNRVIRFACGLVAVVLVVDIALRLLQANFGSDAAGLVHDVATWATFGLHKLFTPPWTVPRIVVGEGLAVVLWLFLGAALSGLVARLFLRGLWRP